MTVTAGCTGFRRMSLTSRGCVTLLCRHLLIVRSLRLVVLVFKGCPELLWGGVTLQCRLLVIVRSLHLVVLVIAPLCLNCCYFFYFEVMLAVYAISTASHYGFPKDILLKEKFCIFYFLVISFLSGVLCF